MDANLIFLGDLAHVTPMGYGTETMPYAIACIKSWLHQYSTRASAADVRLFKHPQKFIDGFLELRPAIVGLSNYMWNLDLSYEIARAIKARHPDTFVIFGGPNYPIEDHARERWLKRHPAVDIHVSGEGEDPFTKAVDAWLELRDIDAVKRRRIEGCHAIVDGRLVRSTDVGQRVTDLDLIPSPYLAGFLDEFLQEIALTPLLESNRGCPFACTFCVDGISARTKVYWKTAGRFAAELEYIAQRYRGKVLDMADVNFGMYKQDVEIARAIAQMKARYGYPAYLHVATGKNQKTRVLECAELLEGSLRVAASVQSLDPQVLINIKRQNISAGELLQVARQFNASDANTYSEVILGLPGDTREKHMKTVLQLADADMKLISMFTLMMLDGTELTTDASKDKWQCRTRFRVVPRCFGVYQFDGQPLLSAEPEEVAVASSTMSFDDYLECREFALTMGLFYQDRILYELYRFLRRCGIQPSEVLTILHARRSGFSQGIRDLYRSFNEATRTELWDSKDDLERFIRSDERVIQQYIAGELGNNVLFRHRAMALIGLVDDIHDAAFAVAAELLAERAPAPRLAHAEFLGELKRYSAARKRNLFALADGGTEWFSYDMRELFEREFDALPVKLGAPMPVAFYHADEQREMLRSQFAQYGTEVNAIGRIISRIAMSKLQRAVSFGDVETARLPEYQATPGFRVSPSEFS